MSCYVKGGQALPKGGRPLGEADLSLPIWGMDNTDKILISQSGVCKNMQML